MDMDGMDMGGMDMSGTDQSGGHTMMAPSSMMMTFFTATDTPLYSKAWTPNGAGEYAGTCIFLIALAFILRALVALRVNFATMWDAWAARTGPDVFFHDTRPPCAAAAASRPWRTNESAVRACLDVCLAGVSYLLMLAVMTMNVGYFLSVLGGVWLSSFVLGAWAGSTVAH